MNLKSFGVDSSEELLSLVKDTVESSTSYLEPQLSKDTPLENFVRLCEDARRDRQLRIDLGEESAALKMPRPGKGPPKGGGKGPFKGQPYYENRFQGAASGSKGDNYTF